MEANRNEYRLTPVAGRKRQAGITAIGFLFLAGVFGIVGLAVIRLVPMYMQELTLSKVLDDIHTEFNGKGPTPGAIRDALDRRFDVEGITLPREDVKITQAEGGYQVRIEHENRAHYLADIWLVVSFDKQIQIRR